MLTVSYSSLADRADAIVTPDDEALEVLVLLQGDLSRAVVPSRWDALVAVPGRGVARSRNAAIDFAGRRYLLFCDDDVEVRLDGVLQGVAHLQRTGAALALGRGVTPDGRLRKSYLTNRPSRLRLTNAAKAATYEMLVDVEQVRAAGVRFDERFGAGARYYLGDEYLFIADLLRAGLTAQAVPYVFGEHPHDSSGVRWGGADLRARAIVINEVFGRYAGPARAAFAARRRRQMGGWGAALRFVLDRTVAEGQRADTPPGVQGLVNPGEQGPVAPGEQGLVAPGEPQQVPDPAVGQSAPRPRLVLARRPRPAHAMPLDSRPAHG